jgi:DNA-directed RNA polymerase subunit L
MVRVKNVEVSEIPFETADKNFQRCVEYIKAVAPSGDYKKYMPKKSKQKLSFELTDANSDLANTIRRFLLDEIPVQSMTVSEESIKTTDRFILTDYLKKQIELVPILQNSDMSDLNISLTMENNTDKIIPIYTRDIIITDKSGKKLDTGKYFTETITLIQLRPTTSIEISDISIVSGVGKHDAGKFLLLSNISYEILDVKPFMQNKYSTEGVSSLTSTPQHFKIEITNHRNIPVKTIMDICCTKIIDRLVVIEKALSQIKDKDLVYFSDLINMETKEDIKIFHFIGEYWTISNVISRYCYLIFNEIKFVCSGIIHPSTEESVVKIKHPDALKIITDAVKKIISDVSTIKAGIASAR